MLLIDVDVVGGGDDVDVFQWTSMDFLMLMFDFRLGTSEMT